MKRIDGWKLGIKMLISVWVIALFIKGCVVKDEDIIVTPEDSEEENTPDPKFNASDWILYSK